MTSLADSSSVPRARGSLPRWYEWIAVVLLSIVAFGYLVAKPAAEGIMRGLGGIVASVATGVVTLLQEAYGTAQVNIQSDPGVAHLLGDRLSFDAFEQVAWHDAQLGDTLAFQFHLTGTQGRQGEARGIVVLDPGGIHIHSLTVTAGDESVLVPVLQ